MAVRRYCGMAGWRYGGMVGLCFILIIFDKYHSCGII
jgi:hypothetical protein